MPIAMLYDSVSDGATITPSGSTGPFEETEMPADNVVRIQPTDIWRISQGTDPELTFDLLSSKSIQMVWVGYHNGDVGSTWEIIGDDTLAQLDTPSGAEVWEQGLALRLNDSADARGFVRQHALALLSAPRTLRYWRLIFSTSTPFDVGRVMMGVPYVPSRGIDFGSSISLVTTDSRQRTLGGQVITNPGGQFREVDVQFSSVDEFEAYGEGFPLERFAGTHKPILFVQDPETSLRPMETTIYGLLTGVEPWVNQKRKRFRKVYTIQEMELP